MIKINKKRKGFTIVELVIVIAVIAILAGVLIPTFAGVIEKANQSSDIQAVRQMNVILMAESVEEKPTGVDRVIEIISEGGYDTVEKRTPKSSGHGFYWHSDTNLIVLVKGTSELIYPKDNEELNQLFAVTGFNVTEADNFHSIGTNAGTNGEIEKINWEEVLEAGFIKLTNKVEIDKTIVIPLGTELSIDLNDCKLIINEQAQLLVEGCLSVKNGYIISKSAVDGSTNGGICNEGTLILRDVNLKIEGDGNYGIHNKMDCIVSIDDSHFEIDSTNRSGVRILYNNYGTVIIKNSSFDAEFISESVTEAPIYEAPIENWGTLDMTKINITSDCFCTINIDSGTILIDNSIGGGLFDMEGNEKDGYARNCYGDLDWDDTWSTYEVVYTPGDETNYEYISNGVVDEDVMHQAPLLNEQIKTLNNGGSITLESDGYLTTAVTISSDATLNLNGHTLTMIQSGSLNINNKLTIENGNIVVNTMYGDTAINVNSGATASINGCTIKYEDFYFSTTRLLDNQGKLIIFDSTIDTLNVYSEPYKTYKGMIEDVLNFNFNSNNFEPFISTGTMDLTEVKIEAYNCTIDFISSDEIKITNKERLDYAQLDIVVKPLEIAEGKTVTIVFDDETGNKDFTINNTITVCGILNIEGISGNPANINATHDVISFNVKEKGKINFTNCNMKVQQEPTQCLIVVETEAVGVELKNINFTYNTISTFYSLLQYIMQSQDSILTNVTCTDNMGADMFIFEKSKGYETNITLCNTTCMVAEWIIPENCVLNINLNNKQLNVDQLITVKGTLNITIGTTPGTSGGNISGYTDKKITVENTGTLVIEANEFYVDDNFKENYANSFMSCITNEGSDDAVTVTHKNNLTN